MNEQEAREAIALTFGMIAMIDDGMAKILRRLDELGVPEGAVDVTVVSSQPFHDIRVRNYEADLSACRIPLRDLLDPAGVGHIAAEVTGTAS